MAIESAGVVLASSDPRAVVSTITLSKAGYRKMVQNLGWAAGYNIVSLPLAAGVLAGIGINMPPAVAAGLMSVSTIVVATNAQLLRISNSAQVEAEEARAPPRPSRRPEIPNSKPRSPRDDSDSAPASAGRSRKANGPHGPAGESPPPRKRFPASISVSTA